MIYLQQVKFIEVTYLNKSVFEICITMWEWIAADKSQRKEISQQAIALVQGEGDGGLNQHGGSGDGKN